MKAYFDLLAAEPFDARALMLACQALTPSEWLLVCLCLGGLGENQFGFGAEVGRG